MSGFQGISSPGTLAPGLAPGLESHLRKERLYDAFILRFLILHDHREASALDNELPEESDQFRFLRSSCFAHLKGTVGLIMEKASAMRVSIPLDLSSRSFIPVPRFIRSCRPTPILTPSLVLSPSRSV